MREQYIYVSNRGDKHYYKDKELKIRHREDGPAVEYTTGAKAFYVDGKLHNEKGPAMVYADGVVSYCLNGFEYSKEDYLKLTKSKKPMLVMMSGAYTLPELEDIIKKYK